MKSCVTVSLVPEARGGPFVLWDDLPAACRTASELGFDAIEIFPPDAQTVDPASLQQWLGDGDLRLAAVGTGAGWLRHRLTLVADEPAQRRQACDYVRSIIDFAGQFGASAIIGSMQGRHDQVVSQDQAIGRLRDALAELGQAAAVHGVPLFYEPLNRYETNLCNTLADAAGLLQPLGEQHNIRLLCDWFHMSIEEADPAAAIRAAGPLIGHVHFVDSNRRAVGFGHLDIGSLIIALQQIGYAGYLSAEALPLPTPLAAAGQTLLAFQDWTSSC